MNKHREDCELRHGHKLCHCVCLLWGGRGGVDRYTCHTCECEHTTANMVGHCASCYGKIDVELETITEDRDMWRDQQAATFRQLEAQMAPHEVVARMCAAEAQVLALQERIKMAEFLVRGGDKDAALEVLQGKTKGIKS